ncbi:MAG: hypothetical protein UY00_C0056G0012 [Candidatus Wolfebacteria bacterium GW2011_GWA1_47_6]|uniref:3D domain-containing protein n=1 Tax=Candidatus Wolfebacteria bacterium GW2011_GWB1_47_1 TaxID=1619007 RepID=A0A0G4ATW1_9BACT|nr:MAG: hypothetical protein UX70_C0001G0455 [Candidatus Wolfebacteria bacterium GW2011_GWB1_47_1]KKU74826.1 MAG: hypothetical protein UY00_C0056G0012 [Candidatus Wolfebacteria bacterium GW2011_GWA1_47_6]
MRALNTIIILVLLTFFCSADTVSHASIPPSVLNPRPTGKPIQKAYKASPLIAITTCYYKTVRGQSRYATGSYRGDIRLNGTGTTYSGKKVRIGHLAADLRYHSIGTQFHIFIDGKDRGIWTVEDKGSAIKGPRRFDLFVGEGDTGRKIAQSWGRGKGHMVKMYRINRVGRNV